jgi:biotin operon repressor
VVAGVVLEADSMEAAAAKLGISRRAVRLHLDNLRVRIGARHDRELFYRLRDYLPGPNRRRRMARSA